jgi:hypothetical protein
MNSKLLAPFLFLPKGIMLIMGSATTDFGSANVAFENFDSAQMVLTN